MREWHLITGEYPPQKGGVSDYTYLVAAELAAAGDAVHVWCPLIRGESPKTPGVEVHHDMGRMTPADWRRVDRMLNKFSAPRRLLVQWVPHGYGYRSMNLFFCWWLWKRAKICRDAVEIMVHEPFLPFGEGSVKQDMAATAHRVMIALLLNAAQRVWVSIPNWEAILRPYTFGCVPFTWLPVPSNIPVMHDPEGVARVRGRYAPAQGFLVGHFGAYDRHMAELLEALLPSLLRGDDNLSVLLLGRGSEAVHDKLIAQYPEFTNHLYATGQLTAADVSRHVNACDVMLQPYQGGVSSRRTSVMTALSHGVPIVTTGGPATENFWTESEAVALIPTGDTAAVIEVTGQLLADAIKRERMRTAAKALYRERFDIGHTIAALQAAT